MLGTLKEKISQIQEGLVASVKAGTSEDLSENREYILSNTAGADVLHHYQNGWECLHIGAEQTYHTADRCDRLISQLYAEYEKQWRHVALLSSLVLEIPDINKQICRVIQDLGNLEQLYSDVELALITLEETLDAGDAQEKQLKQRLDIAVHQEKRRQELKHLEANLAKKYDKRLKEKEEEENRRKRERQQVFHQKFQEDLSMFQSTGFLEVPLVRSSDIQLESVNLSEDETELEAFLEDKDAEDYAASRGAAAPAGGSAQHRFGGSRAESVYFTPSETLENLSSRN